MKIGVRTIMAAMMAGLITNATNTLANDACKEQRETFEKVQLIMENACMGVPSLPGLEKGTENVIITFRGNQAIQAGINCYQAQIEALIVYEDNEMCKIRHGSRKFGDIRNEAITDLSDVTKYLTGKIDLALLSLNIGKVTGNCPIVEIGDGSGKVMHGCDGKKSF